MNLNPEDVNRICTCGEVWMRHFARCQGCDWNQDANVASVADMRDWVANLKLALLNHGMEYFSGTIIQTLDTWLIEKGADHNVRFEVMRRLSIEGAYHFLAYLKDRDINLSEIREAQLHIQYMVGRWRRFIQTPDGDSDPWLVPRLIGVDRSRLYLNRPHEFKPVGLHGGEDQGELAQREKKVFVNPSPTEDKADSTHEADRWAARGSSSTPPKQVKTRRGGIRALLRGRKTDGEARQTVGWRRIKKTAVLDIYPGTETLVDLGQGWTQDRTETA